jgi:hypothetical protein
MIDDESSADGESVLGSGTDAAAHLKGAIERAWTE